MAKDNPQLEIEIVLPDGTIKQAFAKVKQEAKKTEKPASKSLEKPFINMATAAKAAIAIAGTFYASQQFVNAANRQDDAINKLNNSLRLNGEYTAQTSADLQQYAADLQKVTQYGDEAVIEQLAFAQAMGATAEQSKLIVSTATDMAAALNIDFASATRNVSKTLGGFAGELGEVIPELKSLSQEQLQAGAGIELLNARFEGSTKRSINPYRLGVEQLANVWGDLFEELGYLITKSPDAVEAIDDMKTTVQQLIKLVKEDGPAVRDFFVDLIQLPVKAASGSVNLIDDIFGLDTGTSVAVQVLGAEIQKQEQILENYKKQIVETGQESQKTGSFLLDSFLSAESYVVGLFGGDVQSNVQENITKTQAKIDELKAKLQELALTPVEESTNNQVDDATNKGISNKDDVSSFRPGELFGAFGDGFTDQSKKTKKEMARLKKEMVDFGKTTKNTMLNSVGASFANGFAAVGAALVNGENALKAFAKAFIATIGQALVQQGTSFILQGIAHSANPLTPGVGGPLIAAGSAMVVAGGAMSALSGGGASSTGGASGATSVSNSDVGTTTDLNDEDTYDLGGESPQRGVNVQVSFEGSVIGLDTERAGLEIANILRDQGITNGVTA